MTPPAPNAPTGAEIRAWREAAGLTQIELAAILGASNVTISHWERGHNRPSPAGAARLQAIGCPHQPMTGPLAARLHELALDPPPPPAQRGCPTPVDRQTDPLPGLARPAPGREGGCPSCPVVQDCRELRNRRLWCLCEQSWPLAADVAQVARQEPELQPPPLPYAFQGEP